MSFIAAIGVRIFGDTTDYDTAIGRVQASSRRIAGIGRTLTAGLTLPLVAAGGAAVKFASDAAEAGGKFSTVFGDAGDDMNLFIADLRNTVPMATYELQNAASALSDLLVPMGVAPARAAEMDKEILTLAGDLASFNNVPMADALEKIRAGFVGSSEPLRAWGVDVRETAVKAEALRAGLIQEGEALNNAARAQAVLNIVTRESAFAQGNAAREAAGSATQFRFLVSNLKEAAVTFGQILLPVITPIVQKMNELLKWIQGLNPRTQTLIVIIAGLAAALGPVLLAVGTLGAALPAIIAGFTALAGPIGLAVAAIAALTAAGVAIAQNWDILKFEAQQLGRKIVEGLVNGITGAAAWVRDSVVGFFRDNVIGAAKGLLGIQSPSREFAFIGESAAQGFVHGLFSGDVKSAVQNWAMQVRNWAMQALQESVTGHIVGFLGGLFGGGKAAGGPVSAGRAYVVGERGPELFVPRQGGMIVPSAGGQVIVNQQVVFAPQMIDARSGVQFIREYGGEIARIVGTAAHGSTSYRHMLLGA